MGCIHVPICEVQQSLAAGVDVNSRGKAGGARARCSHYRARVGFPLVSNIGAPLLQRRLYITNLALIWHARG
jgi:hypothetical protein